MKTFSWKKTLILAFYLAALVLALFYERSEVIATRRGSGTPLFQDISESPSFAKRGFDLEDIRKIPIADEDGEWISLGRDKTIVSNMPNLPQRTLFSPRRVADEEFTIIILVEIGPDAISFLEANPSVMPGFEFPGLSQNWEIFFNGAMVRSELHLDSSGQIKEPRAWEGVSFPIDKSLIASGTNILAFRIVGDPTNFVTGLKLPNDPIYMDEYSTIEERQFDFACTAVASISGFLGIYFLILFFSIRKNREVFYLHFGLFSAFLCLFAFAIHDQIYLLIPNSDVVEKLSHVSLALLFPALGMFFETLARGRVTKATWAYAALCLCLALTQLLFGNPYMGESEFLWAIISVFYSGYFLIYNVIYFYFWEWRKKKQISDGDASRELAIYTIMLGVSLSFICTFLNIADVIYWNLGYLALFGYAITALQIGMAFVLSLRISGMYVQLGQANVILEAAVIERTRELEEQTAISRQASAAKSQFMATMSHEIRTPINAVIGLSAAELMGGLPDTTRDNISQIYESGSILLGIINDILDISKIEAGRFELSPSVYETATLLHYVSYLNMVRIGSKPIRFSLEVGADFPQKLKGDELRVKQVLNNLISNAIKYTDQGTVTLSATWEPSPSADGGAVIRFAVRDTGVGIPAEDLARLFDSYTQLDAGAARKTEGTGLGLTIAKNLAEMMDGKIAVESACGSGSVFTAEIAQGLADSTGIGQKTAEDLQNFRYKPAMEDEIKIARQWMPSAKALVVDDIKANRNVAKGLLAAYGLAVDTAASGPEGIELAKQNAYDIVFMDHMMPEMDGVQAARVIKGLGASVPIVAMTAGAMLGMREYYLQQGFDDYLSKPVTLKALDELILRWIPTKKWASRPDAPPDARLPKNDNFAAEIDTQRIDTLNHYRASFERWQGQDEAPDGVRPDSSYFERFAAFIETLDVAGSPSLELQASTLADAGRRGDATKIKELLPAFFENLKNRPESGQDMEASAMIALGAILIRLKAAVLDGKTEEAEKILSEMGALELKGAGRDLYFLLYDMLLADGAEKAIGAISLWEKLSLARYHKA